jgi:hypothetical protein
MTARLVQRAVAMLCVLGILDCIEGDDLYQVRPYWVVFTVFSFTALALKR